MLITFLVFVPLAGMLAVGLFRVASTIIEAILNPIWRQLKLSERAIRGSRVLLNVSLVAIIAALAYAHCSAWLPYALCIFGLVARACLTLQS